MLGGQLTTRMAHLERVTKSVALAATCRRRFARGLCTTFEAAYVLHNRAELNGSFSHALDYSTWHYFPMVRQLATVLGGSTDRMVGSASVTAGRRETWRDPYRRGPWSSWLHVGLVVRSNLLPPTSKLEVLSGDQQASSGEHK